jgi:hypothetical protein
MTNTLKFSAVFAATFVTVVVLGTIGLNVSHAPTPDLGAVPVAAGNAIAETTDLPPIMAVSIGVELARMAITDTAAQTVYATLPLPAVGDCVTIDWLALTDEGRAYIPTDVNGDGVLDCGLDSEMGA